MMRFLAGFMGAVVGAIAGGALTLWSVKRLADGDAGSEFVTLLFLGPIGLLTTMLAGTLYALVAYAFLTRPDPDGALRVRKKRLGAALLLGPFFLTALPVYGLLRAHDPPSDAVMLAHFAAHRVQFDELTRMTAQDKKLWSVDREFSNPTFPETAGVLPTRIALYRQKLKAARVQSFERAGQRSDEEVDYAFWNDTSPLQNKGFAYLPKLPMSVLPSLDKCGLLSNTRQQAYRHIDGNWYLHYYNYGFSGD